MPATRKHEHEEIFQVEPARAFSLLHTPSAIRGWWGAARAIIMARNGGLWLAAWGADEDNPEYITAATIKVFDPPRRLVLDDFRYYARSGPLPFKADFVTDFTVVPNPQGTLLRVVQDGFPTGSEADDFYAACETGWRETFRRIRLYLEQGDARKPVL